MTDDISRAMMPRRPGEESHHLTPEGRIERLERIAKLFARAGRRARGDLRSQDEKINILINLHMQNEELFAKNEERFRANEERFRQNEERFRQNEERFAKNEERFAKNEERFARHDENIGVIFELQKRNEERFRENEARFAELAESQANTDRRLNSLIDIIRRGRNGAS